MTLQRLSTLLVVVLALASCKTQNLFVQEKNELRNATLDSVFQYEPNYEYVIRKDDKLNISIWGQEELSVGSIYGIYNSNEVYGKWLMVDVRGTIELPRIGTFEVQGKTIIQLKDTLKTVYQKWIKNPVIDIKVLNKEITVLGEVRNPGIIKVDKDNNTLLELIGKTGGFEFYANLEKVKILRQKGKHVYIANVDLTKSGDFTQKNIQLHPGDCLIVPSKGHKTFDKRIATIIPFTTVTTAAAILMGAF